MSRSRKASAVICVLLVVLCCVAPVAHASSWTTLVPADFIADTYYVGDFRYVVYDFQRSPLIVYYYGSATGQAMNYVNLVTNPDYSLRWSFTSYPLGVRTTGGPPLSNSSSGMIAIDASDFKPNASVSIISNLQLELDIRYWSNAEQLDERYSITTDWIFAGYNSSGGYLGQVERHQESMLGTLQDVPDETFIVDIPINMELVFSEFSEQVSYIVPTCQVILSVYEDEPDITIGSVQFSCDSFSITSRTDMLLQDSLTLQEINDKLGETNDKLDDTNDKLDLIIQQPEQEKQEATDEGGEMVDQLTGALPNESQGFMDAIRQLADSMSYEGTEAKLTMPSISLPAIPGVMKSYKLSEEQQVDFRVWIQKMPDKLLTLVQVLCTLALVVYSFKELYGLISYAMTLKGGNTDG